MNPKTKKGQEEIVGFAVIIIIVTLILLIFIAFSMRPKNNSIESYEIENFIQVFLQHTSTCRDTNNREFKSIQQLIFDCNNHKICFDEKDSCEVLKSTIEKITKESWIVEEDSFNKGYILNISTAENQILSLEEGNKTNNYKKATYPFQREGNNYQVSFIVYT